MRRTCDHPHPRKVCASAPASHTPLPRRMRPRLVGQTRPLSGGTREHRRNLWAGVGTAHTERTAAAAEGTPTTSGTSGAEPSVWDRRVTDRYEHAGKGVHSAYGRYHHQPPVMQYRAIGG